MIIKRKFKKGRIKKIIILIVILINLLLPMVARASEIPYIPPIESTYTQTIEAPYIPSSLESSYEQTLHLPNTFHIGKIPTPKKPIMAKEDVMSRSIIGRGFKVKVTAYDLSVQSCGKRMTHPEYGITNNGYNLRGKDWKSARVVAVDKNVIPLGSKIRIVFVDKDYIKYSGIYTAQDTGGAIKGKHIDFFYEDTGERVSQRAMDFGVTEAYIEIIRV